MTRRYQSYKESGIDWIGEVPDHWVKCRSDEVLRSNSESIDAENLNGRTVFHYSIPVVQETGTGAIEDGSEIESSKGIVSEPQVLVSKLNPRKGTVCIAAPTSHLTVCSGEFIPLIPTSVDLRFLFYTALSDVFRQRLEARVESATKSHQRVLPSDISKFEWVIPPAPEQTAIAAFLDRETAKIDALVTEQRRLIDLLREKRQAVISHAVTKGLNPNAPLKPSGIDWLGDVPEGWEVVPLKKVATVQTGIAKGKDNTGIQTIEVPYLRVANVQDGHIDLTDVATIEIPAEGLDRYRLRPGDVLMNEGGDFDKLGRGAIWDGTIDPCIHQNHVFAVRPHGMSSEWLNAVTGSDYAQFFFMTRSKQSTNLASISSTNLMELPLVLPPAQEQAEIVAFIANQTARIDTLTATAETAIALLQERRAALISAAVTGKIDVRAAQAAVAA